MLGNEIETVQTENVMIQLNFWQIHRIEKMDIALVRCVHALNHEIEFALKFVGSVKMKRFVRFHCERASYWLPDLTTNKQVY